MTSRAALITILLLAACGDDADPTDTTDTTGTTTTDTTDTATTPDTTTTTDTTDTSDVDLESDAPDTTLDTLAPDTPPDTSPDTSDPTDTNGDATDDDVATDTTTPPPELGGPCPLATRHGGFQVVDGGEFGYVDGTVDDAVLPVSVLELVATEGDCRLYKRTNPFCDPPCGPSDTCDFGGACVPYPEPQDLGTVTLTGLDGGAVVMNPVQPGNLYYATDIPYPPWTPGAALTLTTAGGAFPPVTLHGIAPTTLVPTTNEWTLTAGQPLVVAWGAPPSSSEATPTRVELALLIDQHGNAPASLRCDFADDGQGTVPSAILQQLRTAGVSGFPSGKLVRHTTDQHALGPAEADGCMDFAARSPRNIRVVVSGHVPCTKDQDCPVGKTCDEPIETCVDD